MHPAGLFCTNLKKAVDNSPFSWYNNTRRQGRHRLWGISSAGSPVGIKTHPQSDSPATINSQQKTPSKRFASWILWGISSAGRALAWHARGQRFDPAILHQKSTVLRRKYGAFLFAEADFGGLHCFACTVFRLLQAVPIQPPTFDFTPFSKRNVFRPFFQQAAASSPSMYGVRSKLKVMLS